MTVSLIVGLAVITSHIIILVIIGANSGGTSAKAATDRNSVTIKMDVNVTAPRRFISAVAALEVII
jgi:hypothetical protein